MGNGDGVFLLSWLRVYTRQEGTRRRDAAQEFFEGAELEYASRTCCHAQRIENRIAHPSGTAVLGRERGGMAQTGGQIPPEDRTAVSEGAAAAVLASATDVEDRRAPPFRPSHEYTS